MSPTSSSEYLFGPDDGTLQSLLTATDEPVLNSFNDSFDDFFKHDSFEHGQEDLFSNETSDQFNLLTFDVPATDSTGEADYIKTEKPILHSPQPWRSGLWCLSQAPVSQIPVVAKARKAENVSSKLVSPSRLSRSESYSLKSTGSFVQPSTTKINIPVRSRTDHYQSPPRRQRPVMNVLRSSNHMFPQPFDDQPLSYVDAWHQEHFHESIQLHDDLYTGLPNDVHDPTSLRCEYDQRHKPNMLKVAKLQKEQCICENNFVESSEQQSDFDIVPKHSASADIGTSMNAFGLNIFSEPSDGDNPSYRFINEELQPLSDWTSQSPSSSNNSQNSHSTGISSDIQQEVLHKELDLSTWTSSPAVPCTVGTQDPIIGVPCLVQPKPRRATHGILHHEQSDIGSGIPLPTYGTSVAVPYHSQEMQTPPVPPLPAKYINSQSVQANELSSFPYLPPPSPDFTEMTPFTSPRRRATYAMSRTPSPSFWPGYKPNRANRSPSRHDGNQHRRKSIHKTGPVKEGCPETPRHRSTSRTPRTPKTPRTPGESFSLDFVNFTPKDATKLLNDVAPSGSSKTRARREQEARERRKKMSEAALKAVRQAGGDVEALERFFH